MLKPYYIPGVIEAGCDEAGRGPLAGSVFAAAVVLDIEQMQGDDKWLWLNDSKQLTEHQRDLLRPWIEEKAKAWAVAEVSAREIDEINILQASLLGMRRALDEVQRQLTDRYQLSIEHVIADGNKWRAWIPEGQIMAVPADTVVKGDATYMSIAAASILAKTHRDAYMRRLHEEFPMYGWDTNMGYPTKAHYEALRRYGVSPYHRKSFRLEKE